MIRRSLFPLLFAILMLSACSLFGESPATEAFAPESDTSLAGGEYRFTEFSVPNGVFVSLDGDVKIEVDGAIQIDGALQGDCTAVELRGAGSLSLSGRIENTCSVAGSVADVLLVIAGETVIGTPGSTEPAIQAGGEITIADVAGENLDLNQVVSDTQEARAPGYGSPRRVAFIQQAGGGVTINAPLNPGPGGSINIPLGSQGGTITIATSLTAPDGAAGANLQDSPDCDAIGNNGKLGGSIKLAAPNGALTINPGVTLKAGDGGKGGDCTAKGEGADQTASAGDGGRGGSVLIGGRGLVVANVTIIRGNGGAGGTAQAEAGDAQESCGRGYNATATAGQGGDRGGIGYVIVEPADIQGAPNVSGGSGGNGGDSSATAGDGQECSECPGGMGGVGGDATATGGSGGKGAIRSLGWNIVDGHKKGDGGDATAAAGDGKDGATCCTPPEEAGDGGAGGAGTAAAGQPGSQGKVDGAAGNSGRSPAGSGGDGGFGSTGGDGGEAGAGNGVPTFIADGEPGAPGLLCALPVISLIDDSEDPVFCEDLTPSDSNVLFAFSDITEVQIELTDLNQYLIKTTFNRVEGDLETAIVESGVNFFGSGFGLYNPNLPVPSEDPWGPNNIGQQSFNVTYNRELGGFEASVYVVEGGTWVQTDETFEFEFEGNSMVLTIDKDQVQPDSLSVDMTAVFDVAKSRWICDLAGVGANGFPAIELPLGPPATEPNLATPLPPTIEPSLATPMPSIPGPPVVYTTTFGVELDTEKHEGPIGLPDELPVTVSITNTNITFRGALPFVDVSGQLNPDGGFTTQGKGVVAGFADINVNLIGQFGPDFQSFTGEYTMGVGGGLPADVPITYSANGIVAPSPAEPAPTEDLAWVQGFAEEFNAAFEDQNAAPLYNMLNPIVLDLYGAPACQSYLESIIANSVQIDIIGVVSIGTWTWEQDGRSIEVPDAYAVQANSVVNNETSQVELHLTRAANGEARWFTDCGEPQ